MNRAVPCTQLTLNLLGGTYQPPTTQWLTRICFGHLQTPAKYVLLEESQMPLSSDGFVLVSGGVSVEHLSAAPQPPSLHPHCTGMDR